MLIINTLPVKSNSSKKGDITLFNTVANRTGYTLCDGSSLSYEEHKDLADKLNLELALSGTSSAYFGESSDYWGINCQYACENSQGILFGGRSSGGRIGYYRKSDGATGRQRPTSYSTWYYSLCFKWGEKMYALIHKDSSTSYLYCTEDCNTFTRVSSSLPFSQSQGLQWGEYNGKAYVSIKDPDLGTSYYSTSDSEFTSWSTTIPSGFTNTKYDPVGKRFVSYSGGTFYLYNPDTASSSAIGTTTKASGTFLGVACGKYGVFYDSNQILVIKIATGELMCKFLRREKPVNEVASASYSSTVVALCQEYVAIYRRGSSFWVYPMTEELVEGEFKNKTICINASIAASGNEEYEFGRELIMGGIPYERPGYGYFYSMVPTITSKTLLLPNLNDTRNQTYGYLKI